MKRFKITYRQGQHSETQTCLMNGYDAEHAEERFFDSMEEEGGTQGLEILSTVKIVVQDGIVKMA